MLHCWSWEQDVGRKSLQASEADDGQGSFDSFGCRLTSLRMTSSRVEIFVELLQLRLGRSLAFCTLTARRLLLITLVRLRDEWTQFTFRKFAGVPRSLTRTEHRPEKRGDTLETHSAHTGDLRGITERRMR